MYVTYFVFILYICVWVYWGDGNKFMYICMYICKYANAIIKRLWMEYSTFV